MRWRRLDNLRLFETRLSAYGSNPPNPEHVLTRSDRKIRNFLVRKIYSLPSNFPSVHPLSQKTQIYVTVYQSLFDSLSTRSTGITPNNAIFFSNIKEFQFVYTVCEQPPPRPPSDVIRQKI